MASASSSLSFLEQVVINLYFGHSVLQHSTPGVTLTPECKPTAK